MMVVGYMVSGLCVDTERCAGMVVEKRRAGKFTQLRRQLSRVDYMSTT